MDSRYDSAHAERHKRQTRELRGPGELQGFRQTGLSDLKAADLVRDVKLIEKARHDAAAILDEDAELASPEYAGLALRATHFRHISL